MVLGKEAIVQASARNHRPLIAREIQAQRRQGTPASPRQVWRMRMAMIACAALLLFPLLGTSLAIREGANDKHAFQGQFVGLSHAAAEVLVRPDALGGAAAVLILSGLLILRIHVERKHRRVLEQEARGLGFSFTKVAKPVCGSTISELAVCLQDSSSTEVEELMQGTISGRRVLVFNARAFSLLGEGATVTTFAAFQSSASPLPVFQIRAKSILDRCWGVLVRNAGNRDIDPEFAKRFFLLCCADDAQKHKFFTRSKMLHLLQCADHFHIRSNSDWLLIFRPGGVIDAKHLREFVHVTSVIAFGLLDPAIQPG